MLTVTVTVIEDGQLSFEGEPRYENQAKFRNLLKKGKTFCKNTAHRCTGKKFDCERVSS